MTRSRRKLGPIVIAVVTATVAGVAPGASASGASPARAARLVAAGSASTIGPPAAASAARPGYWITDEAGAVFAGGAAGFHGSTIGVALNNPIVDVAATPTGRGYWIVASDGGIFSFGDAAFHGSTGAITLNRPIVGMSSTPSGRGYWMVASDGGIFSFGDATFHGSTGAITLNRPIVGMTSTPSGRGYTLVASDGGIFTFGDAHFYGSTGAVKLNRPIVGIAASASGRGYWMVASDGGVFTFGDATFHGSTGALRLNQPIVGIAATASGAGYWFTAADGGVFSFGDARFLGAPHPSAPSRPVVDIEPSAPDRTPTPPPAPPVGRATRLAFTTQPSGTASGGAPFARQPAVTVKDASGANVTSATSSVRLSITVAGQQTLACVANPRRAVGGIALFAGCRIDTPGSYTLTATASGLTSARSAVVLNTVGVPAQVGFIQQPSGASSLVDFATQPHVAVQDAGGNTVASLSTGTMQLSMTTPNVPGGLLACTSLSAAIVNGVASFAGCHIEISGNYRLHVVDAGFRADSQIVSITAGGADHLAFTTQPVGSTGATAFPSQPVVTVLDLSGNTVTGDNSSVVLTITQPSNPVGAALTCTGGTTKVVAAGVATFAGCAIDLASTTYTLHATDAALPAVDSATFTVAVGAATQLAFTIQPGATTGGIAFSTQPAVAIQDAGGNTVVGDASAVTLTITRPSTPTGAVLTCTGANTMTPVNGVATFAGCSIDLASTPTYTLRATATTGPTAATSSPLAIAVGPATQLRFTTQPGPSTGGIAFGTQPSISVQDAGGNTVTTDGSPVTLTITQPSSPIGAVLTCTGANPMTPVNGIATFIGCSIDLASAPTYRLHATVTTTPTAANSTPFAIAIGVAAKLGFRVEPSSSTGGIAFGTQPSVAIQDAGGNAVTSNTDAVALSLTQPSNPVGANLTCTSANPRVPIAGVAPFIGCRIDLASLTTYTLRATVSTGLQAATSIALTISVGPATQIVFSQQPSVTTPANTPFARQPHVTIKDAGGNPLTLDNTTSVTLDLTRPTGTPGATLTCTSNVVTVTAGTATFAGCVVDTPDEYSLTANDTTHSLTAGSEAVSIT